ncbi:MAG: 4Fe-4S binding protein [Anaerolineae bacterium]|nr:4Fe-4S binding protein [Anaerolineae bacterium]
MKLSRRDFLKLLGISTATLGVGATMAPPLMSPRRSAIPVGPRHSKGVLIDTTKCVGCKSCQIACKQANGLPDDRPVALSATTLTIVDFCNISRKADTPEIRPVKRQCMHCEDPACVSACPVGALVKQENGCVTYDENVCIGCRYCMIACPFGIPKYNWDSANPKINKCAQNCTANKKRDKPACVSACPQQALIYGDRDELLKLAHARIRENPTKYVNHVYGEKEVGGTTMLYIAGTSFEALGFRVDLPEISLPQLTWEAQTKVPWAFFGMMGLLSGIAWWTHRHEHDKTKDE